MPTSVAKCLRVAVIGAGSIGREFALHHFGAHTGTRVVSVVDIDIDAAKRLAADVGAAQAGAAVVGRNRYKSQVAASELGEPVAHASELAAPILDGCDMVYVGVTPSAHKNIVLCALAAGKHVLLEKPLASTAADADALVAAAEAANARGIRTSMNIGMRFNRAVAEMRRLLQESATGGDGDQQLLSARLSLHFVTWPREWQQVAWCANRADGGALRECGTHYLFAILELFGQTCVERVQAQVVYSDGPDGVMAETAVDGTLALSNGLEIALSVKTDGSGLAEDGDDHYELDIETRAGLLQLHDFVCLRRATPAGSRRWKRLVTHGEYGRTECVTTLCDAINGVDADAGSAAGSAAGSEAAGGAARPVSAREGRNAQRVLDSIFASGGEWIDVAYD